MAKKLLVIPLVFLFFLCYGIVSIPLKYNTHSSDRQSPEDSVVHFQQKELDILQRLFRNFRSLSSTLECNLCVMLTNTLSTCFMLNMTKEGIAKVITKGCIIFHIEDERVCTSVVQEFKEEILTIFDKLVLSPNEICGTLFGPECGTTYDPFSNWTLSFPNVTKPPVTPPKPPKPGSPTVRVLHLTDIHYDPLYVEGNNAECGEPLCCRENNGPPALGIPGAGKWGDYRHCDLPTRTLENLFEHLHDIKDQYDYIIWTGDFPPHNVWNQTRKDQLAALDYLMQLFLRYLPDKLVFSSIGNHESAPVNSFPPMYIDGPNSETWLYDALNKSWLHWLPPESQSTILRGAFYTVSPYPGLRIVSINMNYCNNMNWWLLLNATDPDNELQWLIDVLQTAENKHEKVHIIGHIPPGINACLKSWSWNYYRIVDRYESTIVGQFFGHVHTDSFEMFYDEQTLRRPTSVAYISGSVTPFLLEKAVNPSYRIYEVDGNYSGSSWAVLNHENYILNLTDANFNDSPKWTLEYSAKEAYMMSSLYPKDWDDLIGRMKTNITLLELFNKYYCKSLDNGWCDPACRKTLLCGLRTGRSHNPSLCEDI